MFNVGGGELAFGSIAILSLLWQATPFVLAIIFYRRLKTLTEAVTNLEQEVERLRKDSQK
ncbi:MAG: hypothetical protein MUF71_03970 [Candidatus Kapabacteria bacterium]|jgi:hypothetical protein|nr:hypothetical protein [Candidatus Kapabacteria bacterium]